MYTIGTHALRVIARERPELEDLPVVISTRLVAYVGTAAERARAWATPNAVFFTVTEDEDTVSIHLGTDAGNWVSVQVANIDRDLVRNTLRPAGGLTNALYAVQRGRYEDMHLAHRNDGLQYWAHDTNTFHIAYGGRWHELARVVEYESDTDIPEIPGVPGPISRGGVPIGSMMIWSDRMELPAGWLRCDGQRVRQDQFPVLAGVMGDTFGPIELSPDGVITFVLPERDNTIIRWRVER